MSVDVVYILSNNMDWLQREILFSVRSVEKHLKNYRRVFVVGKKPLFFGPEVIEIPCEDIYTNKARNIQHKILKAATHQKVAPTFLLFNDDYFLLKDVDALTYPYYYKCTLEETIKLNRNNSDYLPHVEATHNVLKQHGLPLKNFDSHYPIRYKKEAVRDISLRYNWNVKAGYTFKSIYCNTFGIEGQLIRDCKINHPHVYWSEAIRNLQMFSTGDKALNRNFLKYLLSMYPNPSIYERGAVMNQKQILHLITPHTT